MIVCVHMHAGMQTCTCHDAAHVEAVGQFSRVNSPLLLVEAGSLLLLPLNCTLQVRCPEPCFHIPYCLKSTGITDVCHHIWLFLAWALGIEL